MRPLRGLYGITAQDLVQVERTLATHSLCALQYRDKSTDLARRESDARALARLCAAHGVPFIVNDDLELALAVGADGVHLGRDDAAIADARARLPGRLVGASCYDRLDLAERAVAAGADYVAFGSVFASGTKPGAVRAPLDLFARARGLGVPLVAIGGITLHNAPQALAAGADCLAVISDLFDAPDPAARARQYGRLFQHESG
jgi:thiamine-phosphate pyrophosphorylase